MMAAKRIARSPKPTFERSWTSPAAFNQAREESEMVVTFSLALRARPQADTAGALGQLRFGSAQIEMTH